MSVHPQYVETPSLTVGLLLGAPLLTLRFPPERLQFALQNFARRPFWERRDNAHDLWALVVREMFAAVCDDFVGRHCATLLRDDEGRDLFAVKLVGHADG